MLTTEAVRNRTKTVTRRLGWTKLKAGDRLRACVKCMGLKPGEKVEQLALIEVIAVKREKLVQIYSDYTDSEVVREGFENMTRMQFFAMFMRHMKCEAFTVVTRIEFKYLEATPWPTNPPLQKPRSPKTAPTGSSSSAR